MTQEELSKKCGYDRTYIGKIERGTKDPSMESIIRIAESLNAPVSALFSEDDQFYDSEVGADSIRKHNLYRTAFANALHLILITDPQGQILRVNKSVIEFSGHSDEDLVGISIRDASLWKNYEDSSIILKKGIQQARWGNLFKQKIKVITQDDESYEGTCFVSPVRENDEEESDVDLLIVECYL